MVTSIVLQPPCHCPEFTGCSSIYRQCRHCALNIKSASQHQGWFTRPWFFFFYVMRFASKTELMLFIIHSFSHCETYWLAFFISLNLHLEGFFLVGMWAPLILWRFSVHFSLLQGWISLMADVALPLHPPMEKTTLRIEDEKWGVGTKPTHLLWQGK